MISKLYYGPNWFRPKNYNIAESLPLARLQNPKWLTVSNTSLSAPKYRRGIRTTRGRPPREPIPFVAAAGVPSGRGRPSCRPLLGSTLIPRLGGSAFRWPRAMLAPLLASGSEGAYTAIPGKCSSTTRRVVPVRERTSTIARK